MEEETRKKGKDQASDSSKEIKKARYGKIKDIAKKYYWALAIPIVAGIVVVALTKQDNPSSNSVQGSTVDIGSITDSQVIIDSTINSITNNPTAMSAQEILRNAQVAIDNYKYPDAKDYYCMDEVNADSATRRIAETNFGYMYVNGMLGEKNLAEGLKYYDEAIAIGSSKAASNKLAACLREMLLDEAIAAINSGSKLQNPQIADWIAAYRGIEEPVKKQYQWFLTELSLEEQKQFIADMYNCNGEPITIEEFYDDVGPESTVYTGTTSYRPNPNGASIVRPTYVTIRTEITDQEKLALLEEGFLRVE